jgi:hypothetical protein
MSEKLWLDPRQGQEIYLSFKESRLTLGPAQPTGALPSGVAWPGREADRSSPSCFEVNVDFAVTPVPHMTAWLAQRRLFFLPVEKGPAAEVADALQP